MESHGNNGLKHFEMLEDGTAKLKPTTLDEKQISSITCSILDKKKRIRKINYLENKTQPFI